MISIVRATEHDSATIAGIGNVSVTESHRGSAPEHVMNEFLENTYSSEAILQQLRNPANRYHLIRYHNQPAGFSNIVLNDSHPNIADQNVTKLDRIYLRTEFLGLKLGLELLNFNITLAKENLQSGMWLYAWKGNLRAIDFYRRTGFDVIGHHKYFVTETHYDESYHMLLRW